MQLFIKFSKTKQILLTH